MLQQLDACNNEDVSDKEGCHCHPKAFFCIRLYAINSRENVSKSRIVGCTRIKEHINHLLVADFNTAAVRTGRNSISYFRLVCYPVPIPQAVSSCRRRNRIRRRARLQARAADLSFGRCSAFWDAASILFSAQPSKEGTATPCPYNARIKRHAFPMKK